jgi:hypothetical protein
MSNKGDCFDTLFPMLVMQVSVVKFGSTLIASMRCEAMVVVKSQEMIILISHDQC